MKQLFCDEPSKVYTCWPGTQYSLTSASLFTDEFYRFRPFLRLFRRNFHHFAMAVQTAFRGTTSFFQTDYLGKGLGLPTFQAVAGFVPAKQEAGDGSAREKRQFQPGGRFRGNSL